MVDDNTVKYKHPLIIQIDDDECVQHGFVNMNFTINKRVTAWDKAMYYFSTIHIGHTNIWFIEDDVFFNSETTLLQIDAQYDDDDDLLCNSISQNTDPTKWLWKKIRIQLPQPHYCAMVCCTRMSMKLLRAIGEYATTHKTLFFLEALFPTICKANYLLAKCPPEFNTIVYRKQYKDNEINDTHLFHPVKNIDKHNYYRTLLRIQSIL